MLLCSSMLLLAFTETSPQSAGLQWRESIFIPSHYGPRTWPLHYLHQAIITVYWKDGPITASATLCFGSFEYCWITLYITKVLWMQLGAERKAGFWFISAHLLALMSVSLFLSWLEHYQIISLPAVPICLGQSLAVQAGVLGSVNPFPPLSFFHFVGVDLFWPGLLFSWNFLPPCPCPGEEWNQASHCGINLSNSSASQPAGAYSFCWGSAGSCQKKSGSNHWMAGWSWGIGSCHCLPLAASINCSC